jgi:hypothetical protein
VDRRDITLCRVSALVHTMLVLCCSETCTVLCLYNQSIAASTRNAGEHGDSQATQAGISTLDRPTQFLKLEKWQRENVAERSTR